MKPAEHQSTVLNNLYGCDATSRRGRTIQKISIRKQKRRRKQQATRKKKGDSGESNPGPESYH
jgi:hypothetical protein